MTEPHIPLAADDRVYLASMAIDALDRIADPALVQRLTDLGHLIDAGDWTPTAARDFFELVERYGLNGDGTISFAGRSRLARALAQLAPHGHPEPHALRLAGGLGRLRLALLRHEGPTTLAREKVFPPFKMHVLREGNSCEITVELWTYAEAEARLPNEIWYEMQHHTNDTGSVFVAMDGDTVVAVSVNRLVEFSTNNSKQKVYEGLPVIKGERLEKFEDAYSGVGICLILARLKFMENLGFTTNRNHAAPLLTNIQLSARIWKSWQRFAGIPDSPEQTTLRQSGIITYGFALKLRESAIKAHRLSPVVRSHPAGFGGDIVEVPGVIDSQLVLAGGPQCMTTVTPMMTPDAEETVVAAKDLEPSTDTPPDDSAMTTDAPILHNAPQWHHTPAAGSHGVSRAGRFIRL